MTGGIAGHGQRPPPRWLSVRDAAAFLSFTEDALRKALERRAVRAADGGIEAAFDGIRARKAGRGWRVMLSEAWRLGGDEERQRR